MNFNIDNIWSFKIGNIDIIITQTIVNTWIIMFALIVFALIVRIKLSKFMEIPKGFQNVTEIAVETFDNFMLNSIGEKLMFLGGWFFSVFAFVLISNISGIFGIRPPTADWTTAFALSLATFVIIQVMGIKYRKTEYIKGFLKPHPVFFPFNIIGEMARPVSLSFRLFGNVLAGLILMTLIYSLAPIFVRFVVPAFLHIYFDLFLGALQTYIFCILSVMFIRGATE